MTGLEKGIDLITMQYQFLKIAIEMTDSIL
jgi:hypothetical protein